MIAFKNQIVNTIPSTETRLNLPTEYTPEACYIILIHGGILCGFKAGSTVSYDYVAGTGDIIQIYGYFNIANFRFKHDPDTCDADLAITYFRKENDTEVIDGVFSISDKVMVNVWKNGEVVGEADIINFIEGSNITLTVEKAANDNQINVTIASTGGSGTPGDTVTDETTWGISPAAGSETDYSRKDHTHGTPADPGGGAEAFTDLSDVPASYAGEGGNVVAVKATADGLEFIALPAAGVDEFIELTDAPAAYTGEGGKYVKVKGTEDGLEFDSPAGYGDMQKATYDTNADDIVDKAASVDDGAGNSKTALQVKTVLDYFDADGLLTAMPASTKSHLKLLSGTTGCGIRVSAAGVVLFTPNCYYDGSNWLRIDTSLAAARLQINVAGDLRIYACSAGANPITVWDVLNNVKIENQSYKGVASGYASLNASTLVVENPANATATPTASKIPIANAQGILDSWLSVKPAFFVSLSGNQSIASITPTVISFDTELYDTNSNFNTTTYKFTPTVAGYYLLTLQTKMLSMAALKYMSPSIKLNGNNITIMSSTTPSITDNCATNSIIYYANGSTDYFTCGMYHNNGSNINLSGNAYDTYFCGVRIL